MTNDKRPVESLRAVPADPARTLLGELARITRQGLQQRLDPMFSACDDFFFDLASRARSNADQNRYFESLREVRLKKTRMASGFPRRRRPGFLRFRPAHGSAGRVHAGANACSPPISSWSRTSRWRRTCW